MFDCRATSLEAIFFSQEHWLIGARVQYSDQIEFLPEWEVGITGRYWVDEKLSIGVEFSHGEFREGLLDEDDNILKDINVVWLELTLEF